jgi:competence protein ComEA
MDRSAPWRVLDDPPETPTTDPDVKGATERPSPWRPPRLLVGIAAAAALAVAAFLVAATGPTGSIEIEGGTTWSSDRPGAGTSREAGAAGEVVVDVQGAVLHPGLLRLPVGARVGDAIAAAGGYGPRVDAARVAAELNLAAPVRDGDRLVVPARGEPAAGGGTGQAGAGDGGSSGGGLVDLNTATAEELDALPGIGPVTAKKIIDARAERPFATVDELRERKVVGAATFEKLRDLVTVR